LAFEVPKFLRFLNIH